MYHTSWLSFECLTVKMTTLCYEIAAVETVLCARIYGNSHQSQIKEDSGELLCQPEKLISEYICKKSRPGVRSVPGPNPGPWKWSARQVEHCSWTNILPRHLVMMSNQYWRQRTTHCLSSRWLCWLYCRLVMVTGCVSTWWTCWTTRLSLLSGSLPSGRWLVSFCSAAASTHLYWMSSARYNVTNSIPVPSQHASMSCWWRDWLLINFRHLKRAKS